MDLHPLHERFLKTIPINTVRRLIELLDTLPPKKRDEAVMLIAMSILKPETGAPVHDRSALQEPISYSRLKDRLQFLSEVGPEGVLVAGVLQGIMAYLLTQVFADLPTVIQANQEVIDRSRRTLDDEALDHSKRVQLQGLIDKAEKHVETLPVTVAEAKAFYKVFCEVVLGGLLAEQDVAEEKALKKLRALQARLSTDDSP